MTLQPNTTFINQDEISTQLFFLLKGSLQVSTVAYQHRFVLKEKIQAPAVIQPEALYGIYPRYSSSYTTVTETNLLDIPKHAVNRIMGKHEIFRINMMNNLSTAIFKRQRSLWNMEVELTLRNRIIQFILRRTQYPAGEKILQIRMTDLANLLNETRINVSRALNQMQDEQLLQLKRKEIMIPAIEKLSDYHKTK